MNPTAWFGAMLSLLDGTSRAPQQVVPGRPPVLLVHGIADNKFSMERMATYLRVQGWEVHTLSLKPNWGQRGIEPLAQQVADFSRTTFGKRRFDLVGFSMGGLVTRYYLQRLGGVDHVQHYVTLSAPHHGTNMAWLIPNRGCREMRPGSPFLRDLASDADQLREVKFTSLYTPFDMVIVPAKSSVMPQARNVKLRVGSHPGMVLEKRSLSAVAEALRS
jgi:triacylglycerol lipase